MLLEFNILNDLINTIETQENQHGINPLKTQIAILTHQSVNTVS